MHRTFPILPLAIVTLLSGCFYGEPPVVGLKPGADRAPVPIFTFRYGEPLWKDYRRLTFTVSRRDPNPVLPGGLWEMKFDEGAGSEQPPEAITEIVYGTTPKGYRRTGPPAPIPELLSGDTVSIEWLGPCFDNCLFTTQPVDLNAKFRVLDDGRLSVLPVPVD